MTTSGDTLWATALSTLQPKLPKFVFETWLAATEVIAYDGNELLIDVQTQKALDYIRKHLEGLIASTLHEAAQKPVRPRYLVGGEEVPDPAVSTEESVSLTASFNPRYTFDTFVMGERNRFAYAASLAVSEKPAERYNPFFLYGGVGLGKTHLMHAIAQRTLHLNPARKVVYVTSETFVREFIAALQAHRVDEFRCKYRNVDILLVDDIQFISGKESTQEEFFHTFNSLYNDHRQIVITSDRPPHEIQDLEGRLRSRFAGGLLVDIQPPEFETRAAILRKKARAEGFEIPDDALFLIASRVETNVRELEGALVRVIAYSSLMNKDIDVALAEQAIEDLVAYSVRKAATPIDIQRAVCAQFQIRLEDLKGRSRQRDIALPRQVAMYLVRELTSLSLPKIGREFGGRDHTTVLHACEKVEREIQSNGRLSLIVNRLKDTLSASPQWG